MLIVGDKGYRQLSINSPPHASDVRWGLTVIHGMRWGQMVGTIIPFLDAYGNCHYAGRLADCQGSIRMNRVMEPPALSGHAGVVAAVPRTHGSVNAT